MNDSPFPAVNEEAGPADDQNQWGVNLCTQAFGDPANPGLLLIMGATASMVRWPETGAAAGGLKPLCHPL